MFMGRVILYATPASVVQPLAGPGPGPRSRSMQQSMDTGSTSSTAGDGPARSPDAPADPAELQVG